MFNHVLVVHILVNIAIIAPCKYVERYIALANNYEKYLRTTICGIKVHRL